MDPFEGDVPTYAPGSTRDTAAEITVRAGEETNNVDIQYRGEPGRIISGTVSGPQTGPPRELAVTLNSVADSDSQANTMSAQSPDDRGFAFYGVDDGDYYITARSFLPGEEWTLSYPKRVKVKGADVTGIELVMRPLGLITGRVVLEESNATECTDKQRPLFAETLISAWHKESEATKDLPRFIWSLGAPTNPDTQGNVSLRNLAPGEYRFVAQFASKYWYLQSISLAPSKTPATKPIDAARTWTTVKSGDRLSGLAVTLAQGAASLGGQVVLGEGEALTERLVVYLVPAEREKAEDVLRYFAAAVTPDGKIALNNLAPGRYWIVVQPLIDQTQPPLTRVRLPDATELRARLRREAEAAKREIELKPCQNVADFRLPLH